MHAMERSSGQKFARSCLLLFSLMWLGFSALFTVVSWEGSELLGRAFSLVFVAIGLGLFGLAIYRSVVGIKVAEPNLSITNPTPSLGETIAAVYDQPFKRSTDVSHLTLELVFRETARYQRGTDTETVRHEDVVDSISFRGRHYEKGESFHQDANFTIPAGGMHTFVARNNRLEWFIRIKVDIQGWPDLVEEYELKVRPERRG